MGFYEKVSELDERVGVLESHTNTLGAFKGKFTDAEITAMDKTGFEYGDFVSSKDRKTLLFFNEETGEFDI